MAATPIGPCAAPPCPAVVITATALDAFAIRVDVAAGGPVDIELGGQLANGIATTHTFLLLDKGTVYAAVATNACGNTGKASAKTLDVPEYCPSLQLDEGACAGCGMENGYAYRDNALRDPAATVAIPHCNGEVSYIYPTAGQFGVNRAEIPYYGGGAVILGYLANRSACAPDTGMTVNVSNAFSPVNNVAPAVNNITLPAPNLVATSVDAQGRITNTLSTGATVVSNDIPGRCA